MAQQSYTGICFPCTTIGNWNCDKSSQLEGESCTRCRETSNGRKKNSNCVNTSQTIDDFFSKSGRTAPPRPITQAAMTPHDLAAMNLNNAGYLNPFMGLGPAMYQTNAATRPPVGIPGQAMNQNSFTMPTPFMMSGDLVNVISTFTFGGPGEYPMHNFQVIPQPVSTGFGFSSDQSQFNYAPRLVEHTQPVARRLPETSTNLHTMNGRNRRASKARRRVQAQRTENIDVQHNQATQLRSLPHETEELRKPQRSSHNLQAQLQQIQRIQHDRDREQRHTDQRPEWSREPQERERVKTENTAIWPGRRAESDDHGKQVEAESQPASGNSEEQQQAQSDASVPRIPMPGTEGQTVYLTREEIGSEVDTLIDQMRSEGLIPEEAR